MQELLQQIDLDYYRSARLLIAHAELEQLRQERRASNTSIGADLHALMKWRRMRALLLAAQRAPLNESISAPE
jgi:hypothetical protein